MVNGQKTWTTLAQYADWIFCLVRTDRAAKKQEGISFLLIDMRTPGITVRPIQTLDGGREVNEVFFDDVRVPGANLVGQENKGWDYAKFLLGNERTGIARVGVSKARIRRIKQLAALERVGDAPLIEDRHFREKLAAVEVELKALEMTQLRVVADERGARSRAAGKPNPASSILKLKGSEIQQATTELLMDVVGPYVLPYQHEDEHGRNEPAIGPDFAAEAAPTYFNWRKISIYGGSNEIQRNIIAKAILGLLRWISISPTNSGCCATASSGCWPTATISRPAAAMPPSRTDGAARSGRNTPNSGCSACRSPKPRAVSAAARSRP